MTNETANDARRGANQNGNSSAENIMLTTGVAENNITEQMSFVFSIVNNNQSNVLSIIGQSVHHWRILKQQPAEEYLKVEEDYENSQYGTVWYHPTGITNILSLNNVSKKYRVTYDCVSKYEQGLVVHKEDRSK